MAILGCLLIFGLLMFSSLGVLSQGQVARKDLVVDLWGVGIGLGIGLSLGLGGNDFGFCAKVGFGSSSRSDSSSSSSSSSSSTSSESADGETGLERNSSTRSYARTRVKGNNGC